MKHLLSFGPRLERPGADHGSLFSAVRWVLFVCFAILAAYLSWPYATLWRIDRAVRTAEAGRLADLVDLNAVRNEIKRKLNKDSASSIDTLSDPFIRWMEDGIRTQGIDAVERLVTLDWVRECLLAHRTNMPDASFLGQITHAFFDTPASFHLSVGREDINPVQVRMKLSGFSWRIAAVYY
jgi:hypothetical protein